MAKFNAKLRYQWDKSRGLYRPKPPQPEPVDDVSPSPSLRAVSDRNRNISHAQGHSDHEYPNNSPNNRPNNSPNNMKTRLIDVDSLATGNLQFPHVFAVYEKWKKRKNCLSSDYIWKGILN